MTGKALRPIVIVPLGAGMIGWAFGRILGNVVPLQPLWYALGGIVTGAIWAWTVWRLAGKRSDVLASPWLAGVIAAQLFPVVATILRARGVGLSLERVGWLWIGGEWIRADPAAYLALLGLGTLMGGIGLAMVWRARNNHTLMWIAGLTTLGLAALWRTVVFPPSGDEPTLLFAAWHWLATGSLDLSHAMGEPGEIWSRAIDFRADFAFHTVGPAGGAAYTFHGVGLPCVYGAGLWLGGRFGLALLLVGVAAATVWLTDRAATALLGRPPSPVWLAALLVGGPLAAYAVFMSADLFGAAFLSLGIWGLVRRRPVAVATAAIALPWISHKLFFDSVGLLVAQTYLQKSAGLRVSIAFAAGFIPEVLVIATALALPLWPISEFLAHRESFAASGVKLFMATGPLHAIPGLLVDRYAGLIQFPAWVLAFSGCWWWIRSSRSRAGSAVQITVIPYAITLCFYDAWAGGSGTPGRLTVMAIPAIAIGIAALDRRLRIGVARSAYLAAVWIGVAHAHVVLFVPPLAFASAKEKIETLCMARTGVNPLALFPAVSKQSPGEFPGWLALGWLAVVAAAGVYLARRLASSSARSR